MLSNLWQSLPNDVAHTSPCCWHREARPCENPLFPVTLEGEQEVSRDQACHSSVSSWAAWVQSLSLWEPKFPPLQSESCWWEAGRMDTCACTAESLHRSPGTVPCSLAVLQHTHTMPLGCCEVSPEGQPLIRHVALSGNPASMCVFLTEGWEQGLQSRVPGPGVSERTCHPRQLSCSPPPPSRMNVEPCSKTTHTLGVICSCRFVWAPATEP